MQENKDATVHTIYLALGSNLGNKERNIDRAIELINSRLGRVVSVSSLYETHPEGFSSVNDFVNAACRVQTELNAPEILQICQMIEREMGRVSKSVDGNYSDRVIDIDVLLFDNEVLNDPHLTVPHPRMHERMFVLAPLAEIAPDTMHPLLMKTMTDLKNSLKQ